MFYDTNDIKYVGLRVSDLHRLRLSLGKLKRSDFKLNSRTPAEYLKLKVK